MVAQEMNKNIERARAGAGVELGKRRGGDGTWKQELRCGGKLASMMSAIAAKENEGRRSCSDSAESAEVADCMLYCG